MTLRDLLQHQVVVLDGAISTELEKHGVETSNQLWGALALDCAQDAVRAVHRAYRQAGAQVLTTNTYQATVPGFMAAGFSADDARALISRGATLAQDAVLAEPNGSETGSTLVAGSLGPYGAYLADGSEYTGAYQLSTEEFQEFHRPRVQALLAAGLTLFAVETQPRLDEVQAVLALLEELAPQAQAWVSFQLRDTSTLADGTPLADAVDWVDEWAAEHSVLVAVGVNCVAPEVLTPALTLMGSRTNLPLACYPNSGDTYDAQTKTWTAASSSARFTAFVEDWLELGVRLMGGCCRTAPADTAQIRRSLM